MEESEYVQSKQTFRFNILILSRSPSDGLETRSHNICLELKTNAFVCSNQCLEFSESLPFHIYPWITNLQVFVTVRDCDQT